MINIYPAHNANAGKPNASYNYVNEPVRVLNETNSPTGDGLELPRRMTRANCAELILAE